MKRIEGLFRRLKQESRCGVVAYVTCGDPDVETTIRIVQELERAGADVIELGVPFSDPIADGPVIQAASQRALLNRTNIDDVFRIARTVRATSELPLVAFSYLNPIVRYGAERFAAEATRAGIDAVLLTDLPPEAAKEMKVLFRKAKLGTIFLLAPTSSDLRIAAIDKASDGFVYYVSTTGVTGARRDLDPSLLARLDEIRSKLRHPIAVGFGISRHEHYELLRHHCDAIVVGSAIVRAVGEGDAEGAPQRA
ncbi:MAG: tryptophan synthase subunit alpha, partial [Acidobacteriota bacterium]